MQAVTGGNAVSDWGAAFMTSLTAALALFLAAIPRIIGFILILLLGWFLANLLAKAIAVILRTVKFDQIAERAGVTDLLDKLGTSATSSDVVAGAAKWVVRLITLIVAFDALGLPAVSAVLQSALLWLPNLVIAVAVLMVAGLAAKPLGNIVRGASEEAGFSDPDALARATRIAVWGFAAIVALSQLGIATDLIHALFYGFVAAFALAFGLGGRDTAAAVVESWYAKAQERASDLTRAAKAARRTAESSGE